MMTLLELESSFFFLMWVLDLHALMVHEKQSFNPLVVISDIFARILYDLTHFLCECRTCQNY